MEAEMAHLLEEKTRKLENAEMLIERLKREVKELNFSVALHDRAAEKARALWAEAHPDDAEEWLRREDLMVWLIERVEKAEAVKESLTTALRDIKKNVDDWDLKDYVTIRRLVNAGLRTAEESSVVDGERYCHSEYGAANCKWEPGIGCTSKCPECIPIGGGGMTHTPELLRVIEQNELDKTLRCVRLVDSNGVFALAVDEKYGGLVAAASDMLEALEEVVAITENLPVCPFCGAVKAVQSHRPDCLSREIEAAVRKARGEE